VVLYVSSKSFIEPNIIPPLKRNKIPEPHMRDFMSNSSRIDLHSLSLICIFIVFSHSMFSSYTSPVFHSSSNMTMHTNQIQFFQRVLNPKVILIELQRISSNLKLILYQVNFSYWGVTSYFNPRSCFY